MNKSNATALLFAAAVFAPGLVQATEKAQAPTKANAADARIERFCAQEHGKAEHEGKVSAALTEHLRLTDAQKAAFKEFEDTRAKAIDTVKTRLCASKPDTSTFEARLNLHRVFLEDRLEMLNAENPKLTAFYNSLDPDQKAKFDRIREHMRKRR